MKNKFILILSAVATPTPFIRATTTQIQWPSSPMGTSLTPNTEFHQFISYIYEWGISLGGIAVFIMLVWAGIEYLTSVGDPGKMGNAFKRVKSSILGLALLLTSWLILNTINPQLVRLAPLPDLWGGREPLSGYKIDIAKMQAPPCEFIVVWPEIDHGGNPIAPIRLVKGQMVKRLEGRDQIREYSNPWASAKSFIKLTGEELKTLESERLAKKPLSIERFNEKGVRTDYGLHDYGLYKVGGLCVIDFFKTTGGFLGLGSDPCGGNLGRVQLPESRDFREAKQRFEEITCVEIVQGMREEPLMIGL